MRAGQHFETRLEGVNFTIWQQADRIEVIRHGFARQGDHARLKGLMVQAAEAATHCSLRGDSIEGDTGVMRARLACD